VATESVAERERDREIGMGNWDWVGMGVRTLDPIDLRLYFSPCETGLGPLLIRRQKIYSTTTTTAAALV
jgi:hypothetical protein